MSLSNTSYCHWLQYISCKEEQAALVQTIFLLRSILNKIDFRFELHVFPLQCISHSSSFLGKHCGSRLIILFQKRTIQTFLLTLLCVQPMSPINCCNGSKPVNPKVYSKSFVFDWIYFIKMFESPYFTSIIQYRTNTTLE